MQDPGAKRTTDSLSSLALACQISLALWLAIFWALWRLFG